MHRDAYAVRLSESALGKLIDLPGLVILSARAEVCPLQDPFRLRARYLGWKSASLLLDEHGELNQAALNELIAALSETPYPFGFDREGDAWIFAHLLSSLKKLSQDIALWKALKKCSLPLCSKRAEEAVRDTLWPDQIGKLEHVHVRRAVLTAWLTLLRQAMGSCFATAPAILVQQNKPLLLLRDLDEILSTGELHRGKFSVPMSPSSGSGDLVKPIGGLSAKASPGLLIALHAAGVSFDDTMEIVPEDSVQKIISGMLLRRMNLTEEDLKYEQAFPVSQVAMLWERSGGQFSGISPKAKHVLEWKKQRALAQRAFLALSDCALLRLWEYTLASFSDVKVEFAKWNLYVSLGINPDCKPPGVGDFFLTAVQQELDASNRKISQLSQEHSQARGIVHATQSLLQQSGDEERRSQLKSELVAAVQTVNSLVKLIDQVSRAGEWLSKCFAELMEKAIQELQNSFQEIYDPALSEGQEEQFEDSPAGFRLLAKQGRSVASSWELIESEGQFVNAIYRFFEMLEREIKVEDDAQETFTALLTKLLQYIRSDEFILGALERAKEQRKGKKGTPWAYESGGTMQTLVQHYFGYSALPVEARCKIATPLELYHFLKDAARKASSESLLMTSPTHAFLFYPSWMGEDIGFHLAAKFFKQISISFEATEYLCDRYSMYLREEQKALFYHIFRQHFTKETLPHVYHGFIQAVRTLVGVKEESVDSFLYDMMPLFTPFQAKKELERLESSLANRFGLKRLGTIPDLKGPFIASCDLIALMRQHLLNHGTSVLSSIDWELGLAEEARRLQLVYPQPIFFADTNWSDWSFGFVQNYGTGQLELWRLSRTGLKGSPMREWDSVFREQGVWSVLVE